MEKEQEQQNIINKRLSIWFGFYMLRAHMYACQSVSIYFPFICSVLSRIRFVFFFFIFISQFFCYACIGYSFICYCSRHAITESFRQNKKKKSYKDLTVVYFRVLSIYYYFRYLWLCECVWCLYLFVIAYTIFDSPLFSSYIKK